MKPRDDLDWPPDPPTEPVDPFVVWIDIVTPSEGAVVEGPWNGVNVVVRGSTTVESGTGAIDKVEVQFGSEQAFALADQTGSGWTTWQASRLFTVPGPIQITARVISNGKTMSTRTVTVQASLQPKPVEQQPQPADTTPPAIAITTPKNAAWVVVVGGTATVAVAGTATDVGTGVARVEVDVDGRPADVAQVGGSWASWSAQGTATGLGRHVVTARAYDKQGLQSSTSLELMGVETPPTPPVVERLFLVEKSQLSTFLGAYGPGRTIKTLSLLPGEKTTIAVKSYRRTTETAIESSSILDSYTDEAQHDFETSLATEQANKRAVEESSSWDIQAQLGVAWGWGSASITGGAAGASNASREELAKSAASAVQKHAASASAKRDVEIKSSREMKREEGEEFSSESKIENINMSRTLNFVFRQMNQEYITLLHLVDVRIGYLRGDEIEVNGEPEVKFTYREATMSQLDGLLRLVVVPERRDAVRRAILEILSNVFDYRDEPHCLVVEKTLTDTEDQPIPNASYLRVPRITSTYVDPTTETTIEVPGVILAVMKNVMRTDGVVCDSLLGAGDALDDYSKGLQREAVEARQLENDRARAALHKDRLALELVKSGNAEGAKVFRDVYPVPENESLALVTAPAGTTTNGGGPG